MANTITPSSAIKLVSVKLDKQYMNQLTFSNLNSQQTYFDGLNGLTFTNYNYVKRENSVKVEANIDNILNYNYLFYENIRLGSYKRYYCFIDKMEYVNDNCTKIYFKTDVIQTYYFDITKNKCLVEREHVSDDTVGIHTVDEGFAINDYVCYKTEVDKYDQSAFTNDLMIVITTEQIDNLVDNFPPQNYKPEFHKIYSGLYYFLFDNYQNANDFLKGLAEAGTVNNVISMHIVPSIFINKTNIITLSFQPEGTELFRYYLLDAKSCNEYFYQTSNKSIQIDRFSEYLDTDYSLKNNKLLTFPYCFLTVDNNTGSKVTLKWELFKKDDSSSPYAVPDNKVEFSRVGNVIVPGCNIKMYPYFYDTELKNATNQEQSRNLKSYSGIDYALSGGKLPVLAWESDTYTNYLTQNCYNFGFSLFNDVTSLVSNTLSENVIGGLNAIGSMGALFNNQVLNRAREGGTAKGNINCGDINVGMGLYGYTFKSMGIKKEDLLRFDNYLSHYGYKVMEFKLPQFTSRRYWNFIKTIDCNFTGNIPQEDLEEIRGVFDRGVTFWHGASNMLNYSLNNSIV